jgi:hypothetical protein
MFIKPDLILLIIYTNRDIFKDKYNMDMWRNQHIEILPTAVQENFRALFVKEEVKAEKSSRLG